MIDDEKWKILISYRIEQAKETIDEAELLIANNKYRAAISRIYYGMFYCLLGLALKYQFETSKHQQLLGWFNKNFIHTGKVDLKYGEIIKNAYRNRIKSDYETYVSYSKENVEAMLLNMKEFVKIMENYISNDE